MRLINLNSKRGVVNLFSDYILKKIDKDLDSVIQVTDFNHFFIVNGATESTKVLDLSKIKDEFISEYESLLNDVGYTNNISIMDLIKYNTKTTPSEDRYLWSTFYNSARPVYHTEVCLASLSDKDYYSVDYNDGLVYEIDYNSIITPSKFTVTPFQISSEFPYGYSLSMGRLMFYYSEYIVNQIITPSMSSKIDFLITNKKNEDDEQIIDIRFKSSISEETIKSMILDNFSFDFIDFSKTINLYDICNDIKKPTEDKPWLVRDVNPKDLIVF